MKVKETVLSNLQTALEKVLESNMDNQAVCVIIKDIVIQMGSVFV